MSLRLMTCEEARLRSLRIFSTTTTCGSVRPSLYLAARMRLTLSYTCVLSSEPSSIALTIAL